MDGNICPVDVISMCSANGDIRPLRFRMEDEEHQLLRIDAQVSLTQAGIYIKGEDGESVRNFAPRQIRLAAGLESE